ncbi:MAG: hypothetical protein M5U26_22045 [Planctomycetota bacterium]|nr:hypothetical protein [Planctomycetota bacterium]
MTSHARTTCSFHWGRVFIGLCLLAPLPIAQAEEAPDVHALLKRLQAEDPEQREKAARALVELGESARPALQKAVDAGAGDLDYQSQLKRILRNLGEFKLLKRYDEPRKIGFELQAGNVQEALKKLEDHFGWKVEAFGAAAEKPVSVKVEDATFFEALEAIRKAAGLGYQAQTGQQKDTDKILAVSLVEKGEKGHALASPCGPFLAFLTSIALSSNGSFDLVQGVENLNTRSTLQGFLVAEPGLAVQGAELADLELLDAKGESLVKPGNNQNPFYTHGHQAANGLYPLSIQMPSGEAAGPFVLKGKAKAQVPLKAETRTIESLTAQTIEIAGGSLTLEEPKQDGQRWSIKFTATGKAGDLFNSGGRSFAFRRMKMAMVAGGGGADAGSAIPKEAEGLFWLNAEGKIVGGGHSASGNGNTWTVTMNFNEEPKKLVVQWVESKAERAYDVSIEGIPKGE